MQGKETISHALEDVANGVEARAEIRFRSKPSIRAALGLLAKCALEVIASAREFDGTHGPAQAQARCCSVCGAPESAHPYRHPLVGSRWND